MDANRLKQASIDYDGGVKRFMGKAQLYEKILSKFPGDGTFTRVEADHAEGNMEKLLEDVHEFKGMCGNIGLNRLQELAAAMVSLLRGSGCSREELDTVYALLEREYHIVCAAILEAMEVRA